MPRRFSLSPEGLPGFNAQNQVVTRSKQPTDEFLSRAAAIKKELNEKRLRDRKRIRYLIDPDASRFMVAWDLITTTALAYTALITPLEIAFFSNGPKYSVWFLINRLIDAIFIFDMFLQFFIMVSNPRTSRSQSPRPTVVGVRPS